MNYAKELIKRGKVKEVFSEASFGQAYEVLEHTVRIFKKPGRTIISCTCFNGTIFCLEGWCFHKECIILFRNHNNFLGELDKKIKEYEGYIKMPPLKTEAMIDDLKKLKDLWVK